MSQERSTTPAPSAQLRAVAVVPARLESTRLARKMLLRESGRHLFEHTVASVLAAKNIERVVLATDSEEIRAAAEAAGVDCMLTSASHKSGTDRVHEAFERIAAEDSFDVIINVQGDEPEIDARDLEQLVAAFADAQVEAATLWGKIETEAEANEPSVVKVVCDARGDALYFTRACAPSRSHTRGESGSPGSLDSLRRHIGVYAYRPDALRAFCALPESELERIENLEQLRWLEAGRKMRTVEAQHVPRGIDTRDDYEAFLARIDAKANLQNNNT